MTFEEVARADETINEFLIERSRTAKDRTVSVYAMRLGHLKETLGKPLLEASPKEIRRLMSSLKKKRKDIVLVAGILRMFYKFHIEEAETMEERDRLERLRLVCSMKQKQKRVPLEKVAELEDVNTLLKVCDNLRDRALISLMWESGGRMGEILALNNGDLREYRNGEDKYFMVFFRESKVEGQERSCLLVDSTPYVQAWLDAYPMTRSPSSPLFVSKYGGRQGHASVAAMLKRLTRRAGIEKELTPHSFRHGAATFLLRAGLNEAQVKTALGWSPGSRMLARYAHITNKDVHHARLKLHGLVPEEEPELDGLVNITELPLAGSVVVEPPIAPGPSPHVDLDKLTVTYEGETVTLDKFAAVVGEALKEMVQEEVQKQVEKGA